MILALWWFLVFNPSGNGIPDVKGPFDTSTRCWYEAGRLRNIRPTLMFMLRDGGCIETPEMPTKEVRMMPSCIENKREVDFRIVGPSGECLYGSDEARNWWMVMFTKMGLFSK